MAGVGGGGKWQSMTEGFRGCPGGSSQRLGNV